MISRMLPLAAVLTLLPLPSATLFAADPPGASSVSTGFNGVWRIERPLAALRTEAGQVPPMNPAAKVKYDRAIAARSAGKTGFDPIAKCQPPGLPRIWLTGEPFEILVGSKQIFMTFEWNRLFRMIDMNVDHDAQNIYAETFFGWSTGKWQRDALLVDTVSVNDTTLLDDAGIPHSTDLRQTERWSLSQDGKRLTLRMTFDDPKTFVSPWSAALHFVRQPAGFVIGEDVCVERMGMTENHP